MNRNQTKACSGKLILFALLLLFWGIFGGPQIKVHAADGFVQKDGFVYYVQDGKNHVGWLELSGKTYYFEKDGKMVTGWHQDAEGYRYFHKTKGYMYTGWAQSGSNKRYFDLKTGLMKTGFFLLDGKYYYFKPKNGVMYVGWAKNSKNQYRYFHKTNGYMYVGWAGKGAKRRYFSKKGYMYQGWITNKGDKYYFNPENGYMATGKTKVDNKNYIFHETTGKMVYRWYTAMNRQKYFLHPTTGEMVTGKVKINGVTYQFAATGEYVGNAYSFDNSVKPTGTRTLKNLFLAAIQPIGSTLYTWGGGHNMDAGRIGLNPRWAEAYALHRSEDYSEDGLDCSGYIGWMVFQLMGQYSTYVSNYIPIYYENRGWGTKMPLSVVSKLMPGDILANGKHVWMILGTCSDGSVVILHSAGANDDGPQISGTRQGSEAAKLAKSYMSRYSGYMLYQYTTVYKDFMSPSFSEYDDTVVFRFNPSTISDPEGFRNMSASQILSSLSYAIGNR